MTEYPSTLKLEAAAEDHFANTLPAGDNWGNLIYSSDHLRQAFMAGAEWALEEAAKVIGDAEGTRGTDAVVDRASLIERIRALKGSH